MLPRLFANASDFVDLYSFVRDPSAAALLDGYSNATSIDTRAADGIVAFAPRREAAQPIVLVRASGTARSWAVHAVSWRGDGVERANASVWLAPAFFGSSSLSVTAWQPGGGGAVAARLSPAGGVGDYCCVPPPLRSRARRYSEWLLLDVKG